MAEKAAAVASMVGWLCDTQGKPRRLRCAYCGRPTKARHNTIKHAADQSVPVCPNGQCRNRNRS
jgi:NAD-dependent SIR2 family protein deacetylase